MVKFMRTPVLIAGLFLWVLVGISAYLVFGRPSPDQAGLVDRRTPSDQGKAVVDPIGPQPIRVIKSKTPELASIPDDWEPPTVEGWSLTNQNGDEITPDDLLGKPYVGTFIFTRCFTHCPDLVRRVYDLNEKLADIDLRFVTVSVDPEHDTVEHFAKYAANFTDNPDRWQFLTGSKEEILKFARYGFRQMRTEPLDAETFIGPQAAHSLRLMHVGADGQLVGTYHFQHEADMQALQRVLQGKIDTPDEFRPLPPASELEPVAFYQDASPEDQVSAVADSAPADVSPPGNSEATTSDPLASLPDWARRLPPINAGLNTLATLLLLGAFVAIKQRKKDLHRNLILGALAVSAAFLGCYLIYHWALGQYTESHGKPFPGEGVAKAAYYAILIPHVILAAAVPFLAGVAVWRAFKEQWDGHKRVVRWAYPIWLFVSVTGVVIYGMLYHWPVASA